MTASSADARSCSQGGKEDLRLKTVLMVLSGVSQTRAAVSSGVSRQSVNRWFGMYRRGGFAALKTARKGRPKVQLLQPWQESQVAVTISLVPPSHLGIPFSRWTKEAIIRLAELRFGVRLTPWMVRSYLGRWGFPSQKKASCLFLETPPRLLGWLDARQFGFPGEGLHDGQEDGGPCTGKGHKR